MGVTIYYTCLGNNVYHVTLSVYRDCYPDPANGGMVTPFDDPALISVFDINGNVVASPDPNISAQNNIPAAPSNPCYTAPPDICVDEADYEFDVTLPPIAGGYDVVYQRCCRNAGILNMVNPDNTGSSVSVHIDPLAVVCDNSPKFKNFPPIVICADQPLVFDHSATDADGDSLVYSFCTPYAGGSPNNPVPTPSPPPFTPVTYQPPYSSSNILGGTPAMTIDPHTGIINANPTVVGRFVVGVCVQEYRNGVLIGTIGRDFQFNVTNCNRSVVAQIPIIDSSGANGHFAGIYQIACDSLTVAFANLSQNASTYFWNFGDTTSTSDTSLLKFPSYHFPSPGDYYVTLIANPGFFCADTTVALVKAYPGFDTYYSYNAGCENVNATFRDSTYTQYGVVNSWHWDFGDGSVDSAINTTHHYADGGTYNVQLISTSNKGCRDTLSKQVVILPIAKGVISTGPPCFDLPVAISTNATIKSGTFTYNWDFGNGTQGTVNPTSAIYTSLGTDSITLVMTSDKGCKDTIGKRISIVHPPQVNAGRDTALCRDLDARLHATGAVTYLWTPPTGLSSDTSANPIARPSDTTRYSVIGTDSVGCQGKDTVVVNIWPLPYTYAGHDTFVCQDSFRQLHATGGIRFEWSPAHLMNNPHIADPVILADSNVYNYTYYLTSYSLFGCQNYDTINIATEHYLVPTLVAPKVICHNDTVRLHAGGGKYYQWSPPDGLSSTTDSMPFASPADSTTYTIITSNDCFQKSSTFRIDVRQQPTVIASGGDTMLRDELDTVSATGALTYLWKPSGVYDSVGSPLAVSPLNTTVFVVTGTDTNGCTNKDSVTIYVNAQDLVVLPSAFTPNGDGVNDRFRMVRHLNVKELLEFSVFNRGGKMVFTTTDINGGWDGNLEGRKAGMDTYTWLVRAVNRDGKNVSQKGNVTLIR